MNKKLLLAMMHTPKYFVREHYPRGKEDDTSVVPLLFTHYAQEGIDKERAHRHYRIIEKDPYRFLYDSRDPEHRRRLELASEQPQGYRIYVNLVPKPWQPPHHLRNNIYAYMRHKHSDWKIGGNLNVNLQDLFGKLYLILTWKGNRMEVLLDDVEKFNPNDSFGGFRV